VSIKFRDPQIQERLWSLRNFLFNWSWHLASGCTAGGQERAELTAL